MKKFILIIGALLMIQGCNNGLSKEEEERIVLDATTLTKAYFLHNYNVAVEIEDHEFTSRENGSELFMDGHIKGKKDEKIQAMIDYSGEELEVSLVTLNKKAKDSLKHRDE